MWDACWIQNSNNCVFVCKGKWIKKTAWRKRRRRRRKVIHRHRRKKGLINYEYSRTIAINNAREKKREENKCGKARIIKSRNVDIIQLIPNIHNICFQFFLRIISTKNVWNSARAKRVESVLYYVCYTAAILHTEHTGTHEHVMPIRCSIKDIQLFWTWTSIRNCS